MDDIIVPQHNSLRFSLTPLNDADDKRIAVLTDDSSISVGRSSKTTPSADGPTRMSFKNPVVSRKHAELKMVVIDGQKAVSVIDQGSLHGTYVGDHRLLPQQPCTVFSGDVLRLGNVVTKGPNAHEGVALLFERLESSSLDSKASAPVHRGGFHVPSDSEDSEDSELDSDQEGVVLKSSAQTTPDHTKHTKRGLEIVDLIDESEEDVVAVTNHVLVSVPDTAPTKVGTTGSVIPDSAVKFNDSDFVFDDDEPCVWENEVQRVEDPCEQRDWEDEYRQADQGTQCGWQDTYSKENPQASEVIFVAETCLPHISADWYENVNKSIALSDDQGPSDSVSCIDDEGPEVLSSKRPETITVNVSDEVEPTVQILAAMPVEIPETIDVSDSGQVQQAPANPAAVSAEVSETAISSQAEIDMIGETEVAIENRPRKSRWDVRPPENVVTAEPIALEQKKRKRPTTEDEMALPPLLLRSFEPASGKQRTVKKIKRAHERCGLPWFTFLSGTAVGVLSTFTFLGSSYCERLLDWHASL